MTHKKRPEVQAFLELELCRKAIGALPTERKSTEDSGGHTNDEYESRLIEEYGWEREMFLFWVCILKDLWLLLSLSTALANETNSLVQSEEYWWSKHLLELMFQTLEGKAPGSRQDRQEEVTMAINQLLDVSMAKNNWGVTSFD